MLFFKQNFSGFVHCSCPYRRLRVTARTVQWDCTRLYEHNTTNGTFNLYTPIFVQYSINTVKGFVLLENVKHLGVNNSQSVLRIETPLAWIGLLPGSFFKEVVGVTVLCSTCC